MDCRNTQYTCFVLSFSGSNLIITTFRQLHSICSHVKARAFHSFLLLLRHVGPKILGNSCVDLNIFKLYRPVFR